MGMKTIVQVGYHAKVVRVASLVGLPLLGPGAGLGSLATGESWKWSKNRPKIWAKKKDQ